MRRCIGLDVHREFAEVAIWEDGVVRSAGQITTTPDALRLFAESLCAYDEVALEATCNTHAIARLLERHVGRVVVSNPQKTRAIAEAKVKTDKVDASPPDDITSATKLQGPPVGAGEAHCRASSSAYSSGFMPAVDVRLTAIASSPTRSRNVVSSGAVSGTRL